MHCVDLPKVIYENRDVDLIQLKLFWQPLYINYKFDLETLLFMDRLN